MDYRKSARRPNYKMEKDYTDKKEVIINNNEVRKAIATATSNRPERNEIPNTLNYNVQPVLETNFLSAGYTGYSVSTVATNATSATLVSLPNDRDFYVTWACLSTIKDVTSTSTMASLLMDLADSTVGSTQILHIAGITLTPQADSICISFPYPLKLTRGTNITVNNSTNVANVSSRGSVGGFYVRSDVYNRSAE